MGAEGNQSGAKPLMREAEIERLIADKEGQILSLVEEMCLLYGALMAADMHAGRRVRGPHFTNSLVGRISATVRRRLVE